ncbi:MAG: transcription termination/antitermination protein NusG [Bacillota bacterium]|nr:transcription termination/antitermination protein NusG [Bacillota bacterium]
MSDAKWYVVHTYSGYENKVKTNLEKIVENRKLQELIPDVKVPTEIVVELKENNKSKEVEKKIFPGYVLVKMVMNDETWYIVRNVRGVTGFVGPASKPVPLTEEEVAELGVEKRSFDIRFAVGDNVKVNSGPLAGNSGYVEAISPDSKKVRVMVSMFGREMPVELNLEQIDPIV